MNIWSVAAVRGEVTVMLMCDILSLPQCVIDTEKQMLVFGTNVREQVQFVKKPFNER